MDKSNINWKKISMIAGTCAAVLGIMVSWERLEFLPRWAWYTEVAAVEVFAQDTRRMVLNQEWFRTKAALTEAEAKLAANPRNRELIEQVTRLEQQLRDVEAQLELLKAIKKAM